jgi:type VI protein secretion system component VasF
VQAAAALDAIDLRHHRVYLAPELAASPALAEATGRLQRKHQRVRRIFDWVGIIGLLLLLLTALLPL